MPPPPVDVFFDTAVGLNARLRKREFTARELATAFCDRIAGLGPRYNALALLLRGLALRKAAQVDAEFKRERFRGPLQGVPYGAKDLLSAAGFPTTWGAAPFRDQVFAEDAAVIHRLASAGALLCAKLSMVELAGAGGYRFASASLTGPGLNPWDPARWSGGSSSGSAAAVAAGLAPFALGSETWGSIAVPCAFCGVTGLRPTYGLVSRVGAMALSWTMDKIGPIARTAEDCGHVLQAIAGPDDSDPGSAGRGFHFLPQLGPPLSGMKAGFASADVESSADPALRPVLRDALAVFRDIGLQLKEAELPDYPYEALGEMIVGAEGASVFADLIESGAVEQLADRRQISALQAALEIPARDYLHAMRLRRRMQESIAKLFIKFDLLITPTCSSVASKISEPLDGPNVPLPARFGRALRDLSAAGNLAGLPALFLPCGFAEGLPVGISLVGKPFSENLLLRAGLEFQRRSNWHTRRPTIQY
jgi:aspartyl-tRNA(Asn)/glutamyl-tRNA(Gln) amidotransferase subunit A